MARTTQEIRELVKAAREEGKKIQSHYKKLEEYYSDWENSLNEIDKLIEEAKEEYGMTEEEILEEPTPFGDVLINDA